MSDDKEMTVKEAVGVLVVAASKLTILFVMIYTFVRMALS